MPRASDSRKASNIMYCDDELAVYNVHDGAIEVYFNKIRCTRAMFVCCITGQAKPVSKVVIDDKPVLIACVPSLLMLTIDFVDFDVETLTLMMWVPRA
eukprot:gene19566-26248_t